MAREDRLGSPYGLIYGPHRSRRLGLSLGIDLTPMTCTFDCIYCERGKTTYKIEGPERFKSRVEEETLYEALRSYMGENEKLKLDSLTFSGTGEPTLDLRLGRLVESVREIMEGVAVTIITNSSLLHREDVRRNIVKADRVVVKLNAVTEHIFQSMHQPTDDSLSVARVIDGIRRLNDAFNGRVIVEVLFANSYAPYHDTNSTLEETEKLAEVLRKIQPFSVHIHTVTRPPANPHVLPVGGVFLTKASSYIIEALGRERVKVYL